jgi:hypothetical protein
VQEVLSGKTVGKVLIDNAGGFTTWRPAVDLPAQGTAILRIDPAVVTGIETPLHAPPAQFTLDQNFPNPFSPRGWETPTGVAFGNSSTTIRYTLPQATAVKLNVFDMFGREIATLVNHTQAAGEYTLQWAPHNLASGVYWYRLQAGSFSATKKMVLMQ